MKGQAARVVGAGLAMLAALALVVAAVLLLTRGDDAAPVVIIAPEPTAPAQQVAADMRVQVSGAVMSPGVYAVTEGDRVMDAIAAAGGVRPNGDLSGINLARRVQDEAHYHVPFLGETQPAPILSGPATRGDKPATSPIDLNTAAAQELETLPGIGPVMADRIIAHREANGPFATVDDVESVPGIGPKTLESIRALVTVSGRP